jgi:hypothetical protein
VSQVGLVVLIDSNATPFVRLDTDFFQSDVGGGALAARSVKQGIAENARLPLLKVAQTFPF